MGMAVLIRHGESQWNLENRFTGWVDVPLSPRGEEEAKKAGAKLKGYRFDVAFVSALKRAQDTLAIVLRELNQTDIPTYQDQALNERHYGDLQGLNKAETAQKFGEQQVKIWRRSFDIKPPGGESLKDTAERVLPYYEANIKPHIVAGRSVIIAAHGNSLRALVMHLDRLTPEQVLELNIPTGAPLLYEFDSAGVPLAHRYL
ncbi:2,3-bisphosphoglycerate-dependent phosphoglycerate mutase [Nitrospira tepida]|uniref:2,3-bisphosphoglycerate-dependent phosphoglycerate mutase n=1 Tax=Nitrospira tepida TaxID=2973512 RepID=A0AA86T4S4_9BACT|nr:2,3-bisphosphoglycerate-dependent phosphoglycerate mutase [Nitrospira tepida]CAI4030352.1 2,3-bisphosphoglycerate-dependent phosphoglycerate mutase [Nitrospira tepida]